MGANVIKIEPPDAPDITRGWGNGDDPAQTATPALQAKGEGGSAFAQANRGKRSLVLDFTKPAGLAVLKQLLATADVLVTNIRLQSLRKVGLDYETLSPLFPRLIYAHFTAYGRSGPRVNDPGYDIGAWWAYSGLMDVARSSENADMPRFPGAMGDNSTGVQLCGFIGIALFHRERTGAGQLVDSCLMRSGLFATAHPLSMYAGGNGWGTSKMNTGGIRGTAKLGQRSTLLTDACYVCKDGVWVQLLGVDIGKHMKKTLKALGLSRQDLTPGSKSWEDVDWQHATTVIDRVVASRTYDEWHSHFVENDVWHTRVNRFEDMFEDPQAKQSGVFVDAPGVQHKLLGSPVLLSSATQRPSAGVPGFGEHTTEVLSEIGIAEGEVAQLRKDGIVK
eukprot:gnl/TRDRNA2_/TRDRNA2_192584_c0_seq1.p1 gnl/TRDRNA2_/TRDRNA2_192584_c0~~gnl/TRDRNA2_/TRDRNA2_192584_c0_seq1.p1  ORF type:complete len:450 (-),score=67.64 gnl/TRDRNA2_/TRDRNA2_192584_c0_seq1:73-1245(-)